MLYHASLRQHPKFKQKHKYHYYLTAAYTKGKAANQGHRFDEALHIIEDALNALPSDIVPDDSLLKSHPSIPIRIQTNSNQLT